MISASPRVSVLSPTTSPLLFPAQKRFSASWWATLLILVVAPLLCGLLALHLGQDANWDFRNYHWYNAYSFLNNRYDKDLLPSQTPFFYNPTIDVPYFLLATHVSAKIAGFILASVQGLNFVFLFLLASCTLKVKNPWRKLASCTGLAAMGLLGAGSIAQLGTTFYDNITSLGMFAATLLIIRFYNVLLDGKIIKSVLIAFAAGLPAGIMMGLKLPSVVFCVGLCAALFLNAGSWQRRFLLAFAFGCGVLVGLALSLGHWALFLQTHYGSPLFPYFNDHFKSPLAPLTSARDMQFLPTTLKDKLFFPYLFAANPLLVGEIPWQDWRIPALYTLLPLGLVLHFTANTKKAVAASASFFEARESRFLLIFAVVSYFVWMAMFSIYRYAVPLEMMAPLLIAISLNLFPLRTQARALLIVGVLGLLAFITETGTWGRKDIWLEHAVETSPISIENPQDVMVLMTGCEPYAHILTEFPHETSFLRIQSNFTSPNESKGINMLIRDRFANHKAKGGRFMVLYPIWQRTIAMDAIKYYSLTLKPQTCQTIDDHLFEKLELCEVSFPLPKPQKGRTR